MAREIPTREVVDQGANRRRDSINRRWDHGKPTKTPLPKIFIYTEGDDALRLGFQELFREWREKTRGKYDFRVVMSEGNSQTRDDWITQRTQAGERDIVLLLLDSEGAPTDSLEQIPAGCASFLKTEDMETKDVYFMVQLMEAWFLTRPDAIAEIYGKGFRTERLPSIPTHKKPSERPGENLEAVSKSTVEKGLSEATMETTKGRYDRTNAKTTIAPRILASLNLRDISEVSYHAGKLLYRLESL